MTPAILATGTVSKEFVADVHAAASQTGHEIEIISGCDLCDLHGAVKAAGVDLQRRAIIGYGGGTNLVDRITNAIPDHADAS